MSISGDIADFPLKDILQIISFSRRSGTLRITSDQGEGRIVVKSGAIVTAMAPGQHADFGTLVVRHGLATQEALLEAVERQKALTGADRPPLGRMLMSAGAITAEGVELVVKEQISGALRRLLEWARGSFVFDVHAVSSPDSFGLGYSEMVLDHGLDVQRLLLEAMKYFDDRARGALPEEDAAPAAAPPPAPPVAPPPPRPSQAITRPVLPQGVTAQSTKSVAADASKPPPPVLPLAPTREKRPPQSSDLRLILLHEGGLFRDLLARRIAAEGLRLEVAKDPDHALSLTLERRAEGALPVIISELDMPGECAINSGHTLLEKRVARRDPVPVVLLAEHDADPDHDRAFSLGARHLLRKPVRPTGGGPDAFVRVIEEFAVEVAFSVKGLLVEESLPVRDEIADAAPTVATTVPPELRELLGAMRTEDAASITLKLLEVVARRFPRSILLHLKGGRLHVKGAFGETRGGRRMLELLGELHMDLRQLPGFVTAFETAMPRRYVVGPDVGQIPDLIGAPDSFECLVIPILCHYRPVGAIYADTGGTGAPIGDLSLYTELCNRVSQVLGEALLKRRGQRYLADGPTTTVHPRPDLG